MVVQPTVASGTLVMEAKTTGEPPLSEPYSSVYVVPDEVLLTICTAYVVLSRETFDQGNYVNWLSSPEGVRRSGEEPSVPTFQTPFWLVSPVKLPTVKSSVVAVTARTAMNA